MRLRLINFRCYIDKTFEIDENGLVLISAQSGAGKSTILLGIQFALYGKGKKLQHYGKTSCSVELDFEDMKIVRTKRPDRLTLNDIYEDEVAQNIINKKFGIEFDVTSYICQNALNSFIIMSPTDKLEFLEKIAFKDINLVAIKEKCKNLISKRNDELKTTILHLENATNNLKEYKEPEEIKFPFKCKKSDQEKFIKNEYIKQKNCDILIKKSTNIITKYTTQLNDLNILYTYINSKTDIISSLTDKLSKLTINEEVTNYEGDENLKNYKERLNILLSKKELIILQNKLYEDTQEMEELKDKEINKYKDRLQQICKNLWNEYTKDDCETNIEYYEDIINDIKKISFYENQLNECISIEELENIKNKLEISRNELDKLKQQLENIKKQKTIYKCPSCHNKLNFKDNILCISHENIDNDNIKITEDEIKKEIIYLQNTIKKLENTISDEDNKIKQNTKLKKQISEIKSNYDEDTEFDIKSYQEDLQNIKNYYKSQIKLENEKDEVNTILLNEDFSYKVLEKNINTLKVKIQNVENKCGENNEELSEEELRIIIKDQENYKETKIRINKDLKNINSEIDEYKIKLDDIKNKHIEKYEKIMDIEEIKEIIKKEESNIDEYNIKKEKCNKNIEQIELYKKYIEDNDRYQKLKTKVIDLEKKEKEDKNKYTAAVSFSKNILEAESIAMTNIIESINNYAQIYLEQFFNDNPIIVKLLSFKETKKNNKPQINLEIDYKGMECDLTSLSGGEVSRVVLAFTLALSEMFNSPLILLDECTASLDQDLTTTVFDAIKENFKTKTVIVVAHQVIEGVFDKIIKL